MGLKAALMALGFLGLAVSGPAHSLSCNQGPYIVFFKQNAANLHRDTLKILDNVADASGNCGASRVTVAGHIDAGEATKLAMRRAKTVRAYLEAHGIPESDITLVALGNRFPRKPNRNGQEEEQNRRVEITFGPPPS